MPGKNWEKKTEGICKEMFDLFNDSNKFYTDYASIYNDCYKFSLRKIVPLPFIFKKIDYKGHSDKLSRILKELKRIEFKMEYIMKKNKKDIQKAGLRDLVNMLTEYVRDFWMLVSKLESIIDRLSQQAEGEMKFPSWEYSRMLDEYQREIRIFNTTRESTLNLLNDVKEAINSISEIE